MANQAPTDSSNTLRRSLRCLNGGTGYPYVSETESPPRSPPARDPSVDQKLRSQTVQEDGVDSCDSADHSASQQISESQYYTHRDYTHTFRSKKEVQHILDTGEVKGKGLLQKKLDDDPSGQSSGSRRSTKRTMLQPANNDPPKRPTAYADYLRRTNVGGIFRYSNEDGPPGFL
ncbi:uncharacterized protein LOC110435282 [Sorghum bicolor]|uniref:uncharacterized protein LOC110435282 n=1 Tax=Sorghum bicolor TaxID=4558 RepID=UPI000B42453C|nr:uncharacterized protein LOC110435282 [Sorghum bicolor]|eukprot:XP_021316381.1 uncharacterized protein LOC110435282 [Sorghum bicolor]